MIWYFFRKKTQIFIVPASHNWTNVANVDNACIESSTVTAPEFLPGLKNSNRQNSDNGFYLILYWINRSPWNTRSSLMVGRTIVVSRRFNSFNGGKQKVGKSDGWEAVEQDIQNAGPHLMHTSINKTERSIKRTRVNTGIFERFRGILHEGDIDKRVQYLIEGLFAIRKAKFQVNILLDINLI